MEILLLVFVLGSLAALVWGMVAAFRGINRHSQSQYRFTPLTLTRCVVMTVPSALLILAVGIGGDLNLYAAIGVGLLIITIVAVDIARRSSAEVAAISVLYLATVGLLITVALVLALVGAATTQESDRKRRSSGLW